jgi:hypothetical protein
LSSTAFGPDLPTLAEWKSEADDERMVRVIPMAGKRCAGNRTRRDTAAIKGSTGKRLTYQADLSTSWSPRRAFNWPLSDVLSDPEANSAANILSSMVANFRK